MITSPATRAYCVNKYPQDDGHRRVHNEGCRFKPAVEHQIWLGRFPDCQGAVRKAKERYPRSSGCAICSPACRTARSLESAGVASAGGMSRSGFRETGGQSYVEGSPRNLPLECDSG